MNWPRKKRCSLGKSCAAACINRNLICEIELLGQFQPHFNKLRESVSESGSHLADHLGKNMAAWKTGKALGSAISSYLESRFGIPREISLKLSETAVQGLAAAALDAKNLKTPAEVAKKLLTEMTAALVGKTSHTGAEEFITAREVEGTLSVALPMLAGKFSGLGTALALNKVPSPQKLYNTVVERSGNDINKVKNWMDTSQIKFAEASTPADLLGDLVLLALYTSAGKIKRSKRVSNVTI